jgi:hypothetical protein
MDGRTDALITVSFVSSVLSALGSLFIISNWVLFPSRRIFFTKLIVYLSVANLISSAAYSLSFFSRDSLDASNALCRTQAVLTITFEMASVLWTVAIAWTLYTMVVLKAARVEQQERWLHAGCWGVPAAVAVALLATDSLGPADREDEWCWISGVKTPGSRWVQVGVFYLPLVVAFGVSVFVYLRVGRAFRQLAVAGAVDAGKEWMVQLRLRLYLLVFVLVWLVPVVDSTVQLCAPTSPFWLQLLHAATGGRIMGLLNSLVYGCNDKTLQPYRLGATRLRQRLASLPATRAAPGACAGAAPTQSSFSEALLPAGAASTPQQQLRPPSPPLPPPSSPPLPPPSDPNE